MVVSHNGPIAGQRTLLTEAGFVLEPHLDLTVRVFGFDLCHQRSGVF